jgi:hypothetical protein
MGHLGAPECLGGKKDLFIVQYLSYMLEVGFKWLHTLSATSISAHFGTVGLGSIKTLNLSQILVYGTSGCS